MIDGDKYEDISSADYLGYEQLIKANIAYDELVNNIEIGIFSNDSLAHLNEIVELMTEVVCCNPQHAKINGNSYPAEIVKSRFLKLDYHDIYAIWEWLEKPNADGSNLVRDKNMRAYLISMLFNSNLLNILNSFDVSIIKKLKLKTCYILLYFQNIL